MPSQPATSTDLVTEFVEASGALQELEQRRLRQRVVMLILGLAVALVVFAALALFATNQRNEARRRNIVLQARELVAKADLTAERNAECGLALAVAAYDLAHDVDGIDTSPFENAVRRAFPLTHVRRTVTGHGQSFQRLDWNPRYPIVATTSTGRVELWDTLTEKAMGDVPETSGALEVRWSPDGRQLALGLGDGEVRLWSHEEARTIASVNVGAPPEVIEWSGDQGHIVVGSTYERGTLRTWELETNQVLVLSNVGPITDVSWRPGHDEFATSSLDTTIRIWKPGIGGEIFEKHDTTALAVAWSPDGSSLATAFDDGLVHVWGMRSGDLAVLPGHTNQVMALAWSPDGSVLASASWDGSLRIWNMATKSPELVLTGHTSGVKDLAWAPDGAQLCSLSQDGTLRFWNRSPDKISRVIDQTSRWMWDAVWSPDGRLMATGSDDNEIRLWNGEGDQRIGTLSNGQDAMRLAWHPDGRRLAAASSSGTVVVYPLTGGEPLVIDTLRRTPLLRFTPVYDVAWSPDGDLLATASPTLPAVQFWNGSDGTFVEAIPGVPSTAVAWSHDGRTLAFSTADGTIGSWDREQRDVKHPHFQGHGRKLAIWGLAWSNDDRRLASSSDDDTIRIFDVASQEVVQVLSGHASDVKGVAWSPDDRELASASLDGTIRIWDATTGREEAVITGHRSGVRRVQWSADGSRLLSASEDGTVRVFHVRMNEIIGLARSQLAAGQTLAEREVCLGRPLTDRERQGRESVAPEDTAGGLLVRQGLEQAARNDFESAAESFNQATAREPDNAALHLKICVDAPVAMSESILGICDRAVQLLPGDLRALKARAVTHATLGNQALAIRDYEAMLRANPESFDATVHLSQLVLRRALLELGSRDLEQIRLEVNGVVNRIKSFLVAVPEPPNKREVLELVETAQALGNRLSDLAEAIEQRKYVKQGMLYATLDRKELAMEAFRSAIAEKPEDPALYIAICLVTPANVAREVLPICNRGVELTPDHADGYYARSLNYSALSEHTLAIEDVSRALDLGMGESEWRARSLRFRNYLQRGRTYEASGRRAEAAADYRSAIADMESVLALKDDLPFSDQERLRTTIRVTKQRLEGLKP